MSRNTHFYTSVSVGGLFVLFTILHYVNKNAVMSFVLLLQSGLLIFAQDLMSSKNKPCTKINYYEN